MDASSKVPEARIAETPAAAAPLKEAVLAKVVKEGPEEEALAWDSARLAASNLFYCKCGKYCVDSRGINLWNPLCFRYACRPC
ncbi:unnamed protein product [Symbiodinium natans]|uniref:Uncharacterized protein n=1 Tax=Symbiodinium natans TaxID=878477 RepID=A0A812NS17_9DINO|nr:unnamed protein product [Symbiodinium natans]